MKTRNIPFGYMMQRGKIALHPQEADIVRQIFSLYIEGHGYTTITKILNAGGVSYAPGKAWNKHMVKRILEDCRYLGENDYPIIIDKADFDAVAARKEGNPHCRQQRRKVSEPSFEYSLMPYAPAPTARRMTQDINRALERSPDPEHVRPLIFACAAEKYASIQTKGGSEA